MISGGVLGLRNLQLFCYCNYRIFCLNHPSFGSRWVSVCLKEIWLNKTQRSDQTEVVIGIEYGDISQRGRRTQGPTTILWFFLGLRITNTWIQYIYIYNHIWDPVEILYIWVVAIVLVIAFGGFSGNQQIPDPTWSQNHPTSIPKQARKSIEELVCWFHSGASAQCSFHFAFICMHLSSCSFHVHASSFRLAFISFHVPSFSFHLYSCPFIFLSNSFRFHSNVHACSFHFALISFHFLHVLSFPF